jgi:hypothetical protein
MPTTKPRHQVTETPEVAHALDLASRRWPGRSRGALLSLLVIEAADALEREQRDELAARRALVERYAGDFSYEPGFLEDLRKDWPE